MHYEYRLLFLTLHRHKAQGRSSYRLANSLGIVGIIFPALAVRSHKRSGHESYRVAQPGQGPRSVMGTAARFNADQTRGHLAKKFDHWVPSQGLLNDNLAVFFYSVNLEYLLGNILSLIHI